jgi:hypothetical protein
MRIHGIEAIAVDIPLKKNFGGSTYSVLRRTSAAAPIPCSSVRP